MKATVLKLGTVSLDKATGLNGTLTHWIMYLDYSIRYVFQPKGLDDEGQPIKQMFVEKERLTVSDDDFETIDVQVDILGTHVTHKASGFNGMAIKFVRHINGCFHIVIQPKGISKKTKSAISENDFDTRECDGDKIMEMADEELARSKQKNPSPKDVRFTERLPKR